MPTGDASATPQAQVASPLNKTHTRNSSRHYDIEAQSKLTRTPTTPAFPGATYGLEIADQPSQPPRRVASIRSLKGGRSVTSLHSPRDDHVPTVPPLPSSVNGTNDGHAAATFPTTKIQNAERQGTEGAQHHNQGPEVDVAEELEWGPAHPCFPHMNPHVPRESPEYELTRIIRVPRDWMMAGDLAPTYSIVYPEILDQILPEAEFRFVVNHINRRLTAAYDPFSKSNWLDGALGLLTGWLWEDFGGSGIKGKLRELEQWVEEWNEQVGARDGVKFIPLRRTGYMSLDIQIPDPQVSLIEDGSAGDSDEDGDGDDDNSEHDGAVRSPINKSAPPAASRARQS